MFFCKNKAERSASSGMVFDNNEETKDLEFSEEKIKEEFDINALECFGMDRAKTEIWLMKCVRIWYYVISFAWFLLGSMTFAPIIFISSKINVVFKNKRKSLLISALVYAIIFIFIISLIIFKTVSQSNIPKNL